MPIGTGADEAERRLRAVLGPAREAPLPGCSGETGRSLTWGTLTAYLSNGSRGPVVLSGWELLAGPSRFRFDLPYDVRLGTPVPDVRRRVPGSGGTAGEGETDGSYVVFTERVAGLLWVSERDTTGTGDVDAVLFRAESCD